VLFMRICVYAYMGICVYAYICVYMRIYAYMRIYLEVPSSERVAVGCVGLIGMYTI
jgi:hypothetical protein